MSRREHFSFAAALLLAASSAQAEGVLPFDGVMSLSYTAFNSKWSSANQSAFNLVSDVNFSDQFSMGLDIDYGRITSNGDSANLNRFQLEPTLRLPNGSYLGAYYQDASVQVTPAGFSLASYGIFGGYDAAKWGVDAYLGTSTVDMMGNSLDSNNIGLTVTLKPTDKLEVFGHFAQGNPSDLLDGIETISVSAIGAEYDFEKGLMAYWAVERFDLAGQNVTAFAIGAGYDLVAHGSKVPGTITLEAGQSLWGDVDLTQTQVTVGWLIPLGNGEVQPLSSILRTARGGTRSPIVAGFGSMGMLGVIGILDPV